MNSSSIICIATLVLISACAKQQSSLAHKREPNPYQEDFNDYWYDGQAEITSYKLNQARYGEMREGHAVMIFVTEDFSTKSLTKADKPSDDNVSVLKLNATRNFLTGIYPYSLMTSTFYPVKEGETALKVSNSSQEWCGHTYLELVDVEDEYKLYNASYFQNEAEKHLKLDRVHLEDALWSEIRMNPDALPLGKMKMLPSLMYLRFSHIDIKPYPVVLSLLSEVSDENILVVSYPQLGRTLEITFNKTFPFNISGWKETYPSGWGDDRKMLTTTAEISNRIKSDYWNKNSNGDSVVRQKLRLPY